MAKVLILWQKLCS